MTHPKVQHYVPRFLLKGVTKGKKSQLYVFDKRTDKAFRTSSRNVAAETAFYDIRIPEGVLTIEPALGTLETEASKRVDKIRQERSIASLTVDDKAVLAALMVVQYLRTSQFRANLAHSDQQLADHLRKRGMDPTKVQNYRPFKDEEEVKAASMALLPELAIELIPIVMAKAWILIATTPSTPFMMGDHPVTLHNERQFGFYGNIGFAVPGIEMYMPLSSTLSLYLTCPTNADSFLESERKLNEMKALAPADPELLRLENSLSPMFNALTKGSLLVAKPQNVLHHNALQIRFAERFVFSSEDDFSLARDMIKEHPEIRRGPRSTMS